MVDKLPAKTQLHYKTIRPRNQCKYPTKFIEHETTQCHKQVILQKFLQNFNHTWSQCFNAFDHEFLTNNQIQATWLCKSYYKSNTVSTAKWPVDKASFEANSKPTIACHLFNFNRNFKVIFVYGYPREFVGINISILIMTDGKNNGGNIVTCGIYELFAWSR